MSDIGFEGLERFLHMVEGRLGRWGRPIGTTVLIFALMAFALFCIKHIVEDGIIPFWNIIQTVKTNPEGSLSVVYQFLKEGGIIIWLVVLPVTAAFIIGGIIAKWSARIVIAGLLRRLNLATQMTNSIFAFGAEIRAAVAPAQQSRDPKKALEALQNLHAALTKLGPMMASYKNEAIKLGFKFPPEPPHPDQAPQGTLEKT